MKDKLLDYYGKQVNQLFTSITIIFNQCFDCFTGFMVGQGDGGGNLFPSKSLFSLIFEPCHEKPCLSDFQPGMTQTSLHGYRRWLDIK